MKEKYGIGTKWEWGNNTATTTTWKIVGNDSNTVCIERVGHPDTGRVQYTETDFEDLVTNGKFKEIPTKPKSNNMKRSHLLNFMNSMYTLGQMDWGKTGGPVTRSPKEIETLFNEFVKENG